jgi:hypothetical protein
LYVQPIQRTKGQQAIRDLVKAMRDLTGNLPPFSAVFPNRIAPVVRTAPGGVPEQVMMRWGSPPLSDPGSKPRRPRCSRAVNIAVEIMVKRLRRFARALSFSTC